MNDEQQAKLIAWAALGYLVIGPTVLFIFWSICK